MAISVGAGARKVQLFGVLRHQEPLCLGVLERPEVVLQAPQLAHELAARARVVDAGEKLQEVAQSPCNACEGRAPPQRVSTSVMVLPRCSTRFQALFNKVFETSSTGTGGSAIVDALARSAPQPSISVAKRRDRMARFSRVCASAQRRLEQVAERLEILRVGDAPGHLVVPEQVHVQVPAE